MASTRFGCYVLLDGGEEVLPVLTSDALALPTALTLAGPSRAAAPALPVGQVVMVGGSRVTAAGLEVAVVRTVRPARVRRVDEARAHTPVRSADLRSAVGRGPGLTPESDDELAGHLLVTFALGGPAPDLEPHLHRTTALSASLLRAAARGYAVPQVVAYVDAVVGADLGADDGTARRLRPAVAAIGHSSGEALLRGIHRALATRGSVRTDERIPA